MLFCLKTNYGVQGFLFLILYSKPNKSHKIINITLWCLKSTDNEDCKVKKQCLIINLTCRWALRMQKYQQNNLCLHRKKCLSLNHQPLTYDHAFANKRICFSPVINRFLISVSASQIITIILSYFCRQRWSQFHVLNNSNLWATRIWYFCNHWVLFWSLNNISSPLLSTGSIIWRKNHITINFCLYTMK